MSEKFPTPEEESTRTSWAERSEKLKQTGKSLAVSLMIAVAIFAPIHATVTAESFTQYQAGVEMQETMGDMLEVAGDTAKSRRENIEAMEQMAKIMNEVRIEGAATEDGGYGYNR